MEIREIIKKLSDIVSFSDKEQLEKAVGTLEDIYEELIIACARALNDASPKNKYTINDGKVAIDEINAIAKKYGVSEIEYTTPNEVLKIINSYGSSFLS